MRSTCVKETSYQTNDMEKIGVSRHSPCVNVVKRISFIRICDEAKESFCFKDVIDWLIHNWLPKCKCSFFFLSFTNFYRKKSYKKAGGKSLILNGLKWDCLENLCHLKILTKVFLCCNEFFKGSFNSIEYCFL